MPEKDFQSTQACLSQIGRVCGAKEPTRVLLWVPDGHFCSKPYLSASDKVFLGSKEPFWVSPNWFAVSSSLE